LERPSVCEKKSPPQDSANFRIKLIQGLKVLTIEFLPIMPCFRQVDHLLMVKTLLKSDPESPEILFSEVFRLECVKHMSSNEDHSCDFIRFFCFIIRFNGNSQLLGNQVELHILHPFQVVSSRDLQSSEIQLIKVRHSL